MITTRERCENMRFYAVGKDGKYLQTIGCEGLDNDFGPLSGAKIYDTLGKASKKAKNMASRSLKYNPITGTSVIPLTAVKTVSMPIKDYIESGCPGWTDDSICLISCEYGYMKGIWPHQAFDPSCFGKKGDIFKNPREAWNNLGFCGYILGDLSDEIISQFEKTCGGRKEVIEKMQWAKDFFSGKTAIIEVYRLYP